MSQAELTSPATQSMALAIFAFSFATFSGYAQWAAGTSFVTHAELLREEITEYRSENCRKSSASTLMGSGVVGNGR